MFAGFGNSDRYFYFPQEAGYTEEQQLFVGCSRLKHDGISMQPDHIASHTNASASASALSGIEDHTLSKHSDDEDVDNAKHMNYY